MKNINLKTILLLFVLGVQFLYAQPALDGHERPTQNNHPMERLDNNGDQKLSPEEFSQSKKLANLAESQISALFSRLDKNNDGYLTAGELPHRQKEKNRRHMRTKALDTNQDKQVSLEEFLTHPRRGENDTDERRERLFTFLDKNKDGVLSKSDHPKRGERPPHGNPEEGPHGEKPPPHDPPRAHPPRGEGPPHSPPPHELKRPRLMKLDTNEDGDLSLDEFMAGKRAQEMEDEAVKDAFLRMDTNKDGVINRDDRGRAKQKVHQTD